MASFVHPTAIVDSKTIMGTEVHIGPFCVVGPGVKLGNNARLHSHVVIEYTDLGENCEVFPYASLGLPPQHLGYKGEPGHVIVGPRCTFRESVTVHRGSPFGTSVTSIGEGGYFMAVSHIAHDCQIGKFVIMANGATVAGHVEVGDRCFISATVGLHQWVKIGSLALISGGSMVSKDVVPFALVQGDRAELHGINLVGLKRAGVPRSSIVNIKNAYKTIFNSQLKLEDALKHDALNLQDSCIQQIVAFIKNSKRGILRPRDSALSEQGSEN